MAVNSVASNNAAVQAPPKVPNQPGLFSGRPTLS